ncbi:MAG: AraC family transcriptional regulator [Eubacteriales bacterium]|nr:AraC family transcriptional regulator [Lachnospiraceae bacterium]MDO5127849.1 AraC family transcriptional regulator [Eubacteriales bacterium]
MFTKPATINKDLQQRLFSQREEQTMHIEYNQEYSFYRTVASGDVEKVKSFILDNRNEDFYNQNGFGKLSDNKIQNARYHFVVAAALITRLCVDYGMEREVAYTLSDLFIHRMDKLTSMREILSLYNDLILSFTKKMQEQKQRSNYSIHVSKAVSYILANLHSKLNTQDIANALSVNRSYLSTLFRKELCMTIHSFILSEKIKACAEMLITTDLSYSDISEYYGFSTQSHFTTCFRKLMGCTPAAYRKKYYQQAYSTSAGNQP